MRRWIPFLFLGQAMATVAGCGSCKDPDPLYCALASEYRPAADTDAGEPAEAGTGIDHPVPPDNPPVTDLGGDVPDRPSAPSDGLTAEAGRDDRPDASPGDAPPVPDHADATEGGSGEDVPADLGQDDHQDASEAREDAFDVGPTDTGPDGSADAPTDRTDDARLDAGEPADTPDVPAAPLVIEYVPRDPTTGGSVPSSVGSRLRIDYGFGGEGPPPNPMTMCAAQPFEDGRAWRCTATTLPANARTAPFLFMVISGACGRDTDIPTCPSGWPSQWTITWLGTAYTASSVARVDGGTIPALTVASASACLDAVGYNNPCLRLRLPP